MKKIHKLCKLILEITDEDFKEAEQIAKEQSEYIHPLKYAKAAKLNDTGKRNREIIQNLKALKILIQKGKP